MHNKKYKSKIYRPEIILFNLHVRPLAEKLSAELKVGKVTNRSSAGHVLLQIFAKKEVLLFIIINGRMCTSKIEALYRAICRINEKDNSSTPYLDLDTTSLKSNSWFTGFTYADGNLSITVYYRKNNSKVVITNVQSLFRIEVKQNYSRDVSQIKAGLVILVLWLKLLSFLP